MSLLKELRSALLAMAPSVSALLVAAAGAMLLASAATPSLPTRFVILLAFAPSVLIEVSHFLSSLLGLSLLLIAFGLRSRLDGLIGHINGAYADMDYNPIRYLNRSYRRDELAGVYRASKAALVTPLRDGMNLVAKEYVASQSPEDPGVLILSRFAGAARQLKDALIINPNSPEEISDALTRALNMDLDERKRRFESLIDNVTRHDVTAWRDEFVAQLREPAQPLIKPDAAKFALTAPPPLTVRAGGRA